jgi:hypothetical protein
MQQATATFARSLAYQNSLNITNEYSASLTNLKLRRITTERENDRPGGAAPTCALPLDQTHNL